MKRIYHPVVLSILALTVLGSARAQEINGEFEQWQIQEGREIPSGWTGSSFGAGKAERARSGTFAASVWNWYNYAKGVLFLGKGFSTLLPTLSLAETGVPISFKPSRLTGYYRYRLGGIFPGTIDSAIVLVMLKKFNPVTGTSDTVAFASKYLMAVDEYTPFSIDIADMAPGVQPDSIALGFVSSATGFCQDVTECCYLSIDDLRLSAASGVSYGINEIASVARVYPNPSRGDLHVEWPQELRHPHRMRIYSIAGEMLRQIDGVTGASTSVDGAGLVPGEYLFDLLGDGGSIAARGRFLVE